ncbi:septum formation protein Maf [Luteibacter rhizovicinus DSM 16549]|uniref:dTTP/UTP pyrophosphatase n=1 Tax=Luteibacter rhizovicinus DSM 16549 TaxID=1440763 RepID=A0A0G9H6F0_9GAMM|nr:Maf family protein [Luteibacter rhizovicinus]APG04642.1 septum formation protein Maf [Luteibacter rhizovicinus DSM 16549]KLD65415.1 septum formation inhibitor Maf [Luteibacter rhizovicinus DSM 16549]
MLYLASQSPRRRELLAQIGEAPHVLDVEVEEIRQAGEAPDAYVARVALDKARAGYAMVSHENGIRVIGADTEVVLGDEVFGKPRDATDAALMLRRLSGREHRVVSAVWLIDGKSERHALSVSIVRFSALDVAQIDDYVASGECFGKAGAYAIQGRAAAFIEHLSGSYSGVMGLPLHETSRLLRSQ